MQSLPADPAIPVRYMTKIKLTLEGGGWSTPRPGRLTPGNDPIPTVQQAGWAPGPVWTGAENLASTRIGSLDRPARSYYAIPAHIEVYANFLLKKLY